jgi:predicted amidohydrolase
LGNVDKNVAYHRDRINEAVNDGIDLIIFPELSISGYHMKDLIFDVAVTFDGDVLRQFEEMSEKIDIVIGAPVEEIPGIIYNCALYYSKGKLLHCHRKTQLPNFGMFEEALIFKAGDTFQRFTIESHGLTAGIIICREILFPSNAYLYYVQNTDFLIAISNSPHRGISPAGMNSLKLWERMGEVYSIHYHQNYVFVNRSGFEDGMGFGGGSFYAQAGKGIVTMAEYFEDDSFDFEISQENVRRSRTGGNYLRDEKPELVLKELKRILNA